VVRDAEAANSAEFVSSALFGVNFLNEVEE